MAKEVTIPNDIISLGLDTKSALTKMRNGYSRLIKNFDLDSSGWIEKRTGYQIRSGIVPIKIFDIIYENGLSEISFDPSLSLSNVSESPISLSTPDLTKSVYVDEFKWEVIANKDLDASDPDFTTKISNTVYTNYLVRDPNDSNINRYMVGGNVDVNWISGNGTEAIFDFSDYFDGALDGSTLTVVPVELKAATGDAISYAPSNLGQAFPSDINDKILDHAIGMTITQTGTNEWGYVLPEDINGVGAGGPVTITYDPSTDIVEAVILGAYTGFNSNLITVAAYSKSTEENLVLMDAVELDGDGNITLRFHVVHIAGQTPQQSVDDFIKDLIVVARQVPVANHAIRVANGDQTYTFDNIQNEFNIYDVYVRSALTGNYTEVLPTSIYYDRSLKSVTINLDTDDDVETVLLIWAEAETPLNKIQIAGDFTDYNRGHVWGIPHEDNYAITAIYGGRIAGLINRSDVGEQELIASLGGSFYSDIKGTNLTLLSDNPFYVDGLNEKTNNLWNSEDYYIPSPEVNMNVVADLGGGIQTYYGKRFLTGDEELLGAKGRGFTVTRSDANEVDSEGFLRIPNDKLGYDPQTQTLSIRFTVGEYIFSRDWTDPTSYYNEYFTDNDYISFVETGIEYLNGSFGVTGYDAVNQIVYVDVSGLPSNFCLSDIPTLKLGCFSSTFLCTNNKLEIGTVVDNSVFGVEDALIVRKMGTEQSLSTVTIDNIMTTKILPDGINLAGSTATNKLNLPTVYNLVYGDTLIIGDYKKRFKVIDITVVNLDSAGNPEEVIITLDSDLIVTDPLVNRMSIVKVGRWNPILGSIDYPTSSEYPFQYLDNFGYAFQEVVNLEVIKDVVLVDNYANTTFKYDSNKLYRAGLPNWSPIYNVYEDANAKQKISVQKIYGGYLEFETLVDASGNADSDQIVVRSYKRQLEGGASWESYIGRSFGFLNASTGNRVKAVLDSVTFNEFETLKDYTELRFRDLTIADLGTLGITVTTADVYPFGDNRSIGNYIGVPQTYNYMARLYATDAQGNKVISKNSGFDDYQIEQTFDSALAVQLKIPDYYLRERSNTRWEIELVRTKADGPPVYYFITSVLLNQLSSDRYMVFDATSDGALLEGDLDSLAGFAAGGDTLATTIREPARALYTTTTDNRYIQANVQSEELLQLTFIPEYTDPTFEYDNGTEYDSRLAGSKLCVNGQSFTTDDGDEYSIAYDISPSILDRTAGDRLITALTIVDVDSGDSWTDTSSDTGEFIRVDLDASSFDSGFPSAITIHSPITDRNEQYNQDYGVLQGTHPVVGYKSDGVIISVYITNPFTKATSSSLTMGGSPRGFIHYMESVINGGLTSHVFKVNAPVYPFITNPTGVSYYGQFYDVKSNLRTNSVGIVVGSQMTDTAEYVYHLQEILDRLGSIESVSYTVVPASRNPDGSSSGLTAVGYPVFPFYTSRDTTDKNFIEFNPKSSREKGFSFQWKNGKQCILAYRGLIINQPTLSSDYDFFKYVYPSRVLLSSANYPEIMNNPYIENTTDNSGVIGSLSAVDINADDGQEITGITSFLTESIFSAANLDSVVMVFKTNSVYVLDVNTKKVSKIETFGVGCSISNSIQSTSQGITFANESGVYLIDRSFQIYYVGSALEGIWQGGLDTDSLGEVSSFNNVKERQFYISVPTNNEEHLTLVYDYSLNDPLAKTDVNGWSIYDGFIPSVWATTNSNFYYGSFQGTVMEDRDSGDVTDYRDDESSINATLELAPTSFGDSGTRAQLDKVITHFDYKTSITNCVISTAVDTSTDFERAGSVNITDDGRRTRSLSVNPPQRHALFFQVKWEHNTIDETIRITGVDYKASQLSDKGIEEAGD